MTMCLWLWVGMVLFGVHTLDDANLNQKMAAKCGGEMRAYSTATCIHGMFGAVSEEFV